MRRLPARTVFVLSLLLALLCLGGSAWLFLRGPWWLGLLLLALAGWFGTDAWRSWTWTRAP